MQFQADILGIESYAKTWNNSLGAAFLAGLSVGYWKNLDELKLLNETENFEPSMNESRKEQLYKAGRKLWKQPSLVETTNTGRIKRFI